MNTQFCRVGKTKPNFSKFLSAKEIEKHLKYIKDEFKNLVVKDFISTT